MKQDLQNVERETQVPEKLLNAIADPQGIVNPSEESNHRQGVEQEVQGDGGPSEARLQVEHNHQLSLQTNTLQPEENWKVREGLKGPVLWAKITFC